MNVKTRNLAIVFWLGLASVSAAQGFAGLGTDAAGYAQPTPRAFDFPDDHGPHPEFRIEWWYVTANLQGTDGAQYGIQWTLFRSALSPEPARGWATPQAWLAHAAMTSRQQHLFAEKLARGGIGQAGVTAQPFSAWIDDWQMHGTSLRDVQLRAGADGWNYELSLHTDKPFVPQGDNGFSVKSAEGQVSHYYSQPFYQVTGQLTFPDTDPVAVHGVAWLDREWSSQPLGADQDGWDWISLHFDDGSKLMGFQLREKSGERYTSATWINAQGHPTPLPNGALKFTASRSSVVAQRDVPIEWHIKLPEYNVDITIEALNEQAWNATSIAYWEGPVTISGSHSGIGYMEMTGYD